VDRAEDLLCIPADASQFAVLMEPLSVVEKAVATALRLHQGEPRSAIVIGAGTIGLLAASVLRLRGFDVRIVSVEPHGSDRERLATRAGGEYSNTAEGKADIVIEAAGAPAAVASALSALAPLGVLVILGANSSGAELPLIDLIVGNQVIVGSVNAGPEAFTSAASDLPLLPRELLSEMVQYRSFSDYRSSFTGEPGGAPKVVHIFD
jgi:glucose 1-dehydrogenase